MKFNPEDFWGIKRKEGEFLVGDKVRVKHREGKTFIGGQYTACVTIKRLINEGKLDKKYLSQFRSGKEMDEGMYEVIGVNDEYSIKRYVLLEAFGTHVYEMSNEYNEMKLGW